MDNRSGLKKKYTTERELVKEHNLKPLLLYGATRDTLLYLEASLQQIGIANTSTVSYFRLKREKGSYEIPGGCYVLLEKLKPDILLVPLYENTPLIIG